MIKEYQNIIDAVCERFNHSISQLDVVIWLENFESSDWKKALIILNNFEYFSTKSIINEFDEGLKKILSETNEKVFLIPVGKVGKSGMAMVYYLKKTPSFTSKNISLIDGNDFSTITDNCKIVLVDDFAGTGETISDFYESIKSKLPLVHSPISLTIVYMEKAKELLEEKNIEVVGNQRISCFAARGSVFGYFPKMKAIRNFAFEYGNKLYPEKKYRKGTTRLHPLGFSNTQALIGFEHAIPNNTLSIIWSDAKVQGGDKKWTPLFPRRGNLIMERAKEFKQEKRYWSSIIYKLELHENVFTKDERYSRETIELISLIYLKRKQRNTLVICQILSLNLSEYDLIIKRGQAKDLFTNEEDLTDKATNILEEIKKKVRFQKNTFVNTELTIEEDMLYIPKSFRGSS